MDMVKMGSFLAELRKEHNFTQTELGEKPCFFSIFKKQMEFYLVFRFQREENLK